jgi:glycosyltransferase involved in cell wall biosynthesis
VIRFSIIIPNLHSPTIDRTVASLENQTFDPERFEIIVVGMDRFDLVQTGRRVYVDASDRPLSPARARNRGAAGARGEVLAFLDADCEAQKDWLAVLDERLQDPQVAVVGGGIEFDTRSYWRLADNLSMFYEYLALHPPGERDQLPSLNLAIRRCAFEETGGFDAERYPRPAGEDSDLTIRLRQRGYVLKFEPRAVVYHNPTRKSLPDLLRHGYFQGKYSTKVDRRYAGKEGLPGIFRSRAGLVLLSPLLSAAVTLRMFTRYPYLRQYWRAAPAVLLAKLAWCLGAANHPDYGDPL